jgi:hypothetical protein
LNFHCEMEIKPCTNEGANMYEVRVLMVLIQNGLQYGTLSKNNLIKNYLWKYYCIWHAS